jgi:hypothetical protein
MKSEPEMVWTLIESFPLSMKDKYERQSFTKDFPSNEESFNWSDYRLSRSVMQHVKRDATHWRATCNYDKGGLNKTDYIRGLLIDMDILTYLGSSTCAKVEYINVRGISCENCTAYFKQNTNSHAFVDSGYGSKIGCQWDGRNGSISLGLVNNCDNFGKYIITNPSHRCTASPSSTTQWWLGIMA